MRKRTGWKRHLGVTLFLAMVVGTIGPSEALAACCATEPWLCRVKTRHS